ncbi:hypothetical protein B566_EDAN007961 [Ephemera danica]|nr:hypothetical protein B566_EDAN007961 [Ephemera danica]
MVASDAGNLQHTIPGCPYRRAFHPCILSHLLHLCQRVRQRSVQPIRNRPALPSSQHQSATCKQIMRDKINYAGKTFCHTLHAMGHVGESWLVNKKCADRSECTRSSVGCTRNDGQTVCVSCCDESYCNEPVPRSNATATLNSTRNAATPHATCPWLLFLLLLPPSISLWSPDVT